MKEKSTTEIFPVVRKEVNREVIEKVSDTCNMLISFVLLPQVSDTFCQFQPANKDLMIKLIINLINE